MDKKKIGALVAAGAIAVGGLSGYAVDMANPSAEQIATIVADAELLATETGYAEGELAGYEIGFGAGLDSAEPDVITVVEKEFINNTIEVEVDNENLPMVLEWIYDNAETSIEAITDDLDDDEVAELVDRIAFWNEIKDLAAEKVKHKGEDELDGENFFDVDLNETIEFDEDDIDDFDVDNDHDDIEIDDFDYEDKDADIYVWADVEHNDKDYKVKFLVEVRDGEVDDIEVDEIELA